MNFIFFLLRKSCFTFVPITSLDKFQRMGIKPETLQSPYSNSQPSTTTGNFWPKHACACYLLLKQSYADKMKNNYFDSCYSIFSSINKSYFTSHA